MTSRRRISKLKTDAFFEAASGQAYRTTDLQSILLQHRETWIVPKSMSPPKFLDYLVRRTEMRALAESGVTLPIIQSALRHAKPSTTAEYTHRVNSVQIKAQGQFLKAIKIAKPASAS